MTARLKTEPIGKLLFQFALPAIVSTTAMSLFNVIDSMFIGQILGAFAISGLAIAFPFMNLTAAFGMLVGIGSSILISVTLGKGEKEKVKKIFNNMILTNIIFGLIVSIISLSFLDEILFYFGASENTLPYAKEYMQILLIGNVITHIYFSINTVFRAVGYPLKSMQAVLQTVVINVALDALFIYVLDMGIKGAAIATVLAQIISLLWQINQLKDKIDILEINFKENKFEFYIIKNIIKIGSPQFLMSVSACIVSILINRSLYDYGGDLEIGAFGIANRVIFIFLMIVIGISQGMQPISGYNYGAGQYDRVIKVLKLAVLGATCLTTLCFIVGFFFAPFVSSLFTKDKVLLEHSIHALQITVIMMPFVGFGIITSTFFQSIGKARISTILSLSRQVIFYIPALFILPSYMGVDGVWYSAPLSDLAFVITATILLFIHLPKLEKQNIGQHQ